MQDQLTLADIVRNALDDAYSVELAAIDLGKLMCEMELINRRFVTGSHRLVELERIIPLQKKLALVEGTGRPTICATR